MTSSLNHLTDGQIITALVDATDLAPEAGRHLMDCLHCQTRIASLDGELEKLGHLAQQMLPAPTRKPLPAAPQASWRYRVHRPALAAGLALLLLLTGLWLWPGLQPQPPTPADTQAASDFYFLEDIVEDADLPEHYQGIIVAANASFSDEFLAYVSGDP
jgi:hypothetical protein